MELENCKKYIACRANPDTVYVSPQRRIEELEAEIVTLQKQLCGHVSRIVAQSDLLSRADERSRQRCEALRLEIACAVKTAWEEPNGYGCELNMVLAKIAEVPLPEVK